jgi:hypothetical protein
MMMKKKNFSNSLLLFDEQHAKCICFVVYNTIKHINAPLNFDVFVFLFANFTNHINAPLNFYLFLLFVNLLITLMHY